MWIVNLAIRRPYTFVVFALLILILGIWFIKNTSKDIFPSVDIPVISVIWTYAGLPAEEFEQRITTYSEYSLSSNVNDIERIESQTLDGVGLIRLYFHPNANMPMALATTTATSQSILRRMPVGVQPPIILQYTANSVPIIQMVLSSNIFTESELYDYGIYRVRQFIATIQGTTFPTPYGGKPRELMIDLDPVALQAKGLSPRDVNDAINAQSLILPTGNARIGDKDYRINVNNTPDLATDYNNYPIKVVDDVVIYVRDVAHAHDGFVPQVNIVRNDGHRSILLTVLKNGTASTLDIVNQVWEMLPTLRASAPKGMNIDLLFDQSVFVRAAIKSVVEEGVLAALLTGIMILLFLGSWRSTLIVVISIPLSILASIVILSLMGESLNVMTLGGLALAIGILVDDATVTIENIHRNIALGKPLRQAVLDGSYQIAIPAFVSTTAICIVFLPVALLVGPSKFLFVPFAYAVVFAVAASYILSRTLVPVMIDFLLKDELHLYNTADNSNVKKSWLDRFHDRFNEKFNNFKEHYENALDWALTYRITLLIMFGLLFLSALLLVPFIGRDFFPAVDASQFRLHVRAPTGTRIEVTEEIFGKVEDEIKKILPPNTIDLMIDNIGVVSQAYNLAFGDNATVGPFDGEILVSLKREREKTTQEYMKIIREQLNKKFPDLLFYFQPADMISQILNFGLPAPINVRVVGYDKANNIKIARELVEKIERIPGAVDVHLHQILDYPELFIHVDRTKLLQNGLYQRDIMNDILLSYSSSDVVTPNFWLDRKMGIPYQISVQTPKYRIDNIETLMRMPIATSGKTESQLLNNLAKIERRSTPSVTSHLNIQPVYDIFANVQGTDLGSVSSEIHKIINEYKEKLKPGNTIQMKGVVESMDTAFGRLAIGFLFAILLIYFIMVINFQSWLDPFIIIMALPGAISGIIWMLYLTHTTFNVPSLMGTIMSLGVAVANSILLVTFANTQLHEGMNSVQAMHSAGGIRLRPVLMTALAMIVGMLPMALALGEGSEQNAPLGRAVIGGLIVATLTTLFFVPVVFSYLRTKPNPYLYQKPGVNEQTTHQDF